jgi:hypothetical protein
MKGLRIYWYFDLLRNKIWRRLPLYLLLAFCSDNFFYRFRFVHVFKLHFNCLLKKNYFNLLNCPVARELWNMILCLSSVSWVMPWGVVDLISCWNGRVGRHEAGKIWKVIPHCIMWCLWCEQNAKTFNREEASIPAMKLSLLQTMFEWLKASSQLSFYS